MGAFETVGNTIEFFLNIVELIALILSIITFVYVMFNKFSKALKTILGPCGLTVGNKLRILFICRRSPVRKRTFIEYAILKTQGYCITKAEWRALIIEFQSKYLDNDDRPSYRVDNCTVLIGKDFSAAAKRYFDYFKKEDVKKAYGISDDLIQWIITIHIEEAYAMPTILLNGLLAQYEENWSEFVNRYVSTAYMSEDSASKNRILPSELYMTFAWLLWGPSYELGSNKTRLLQLSYGDESNSLPAIASDAVIEGIQQRIDENSTAKKRYGALMSVDLSVYSIHEYFKSIQSELMPDYLYFYDQIEKDDYPFALQIDAFTPNEGYKSKKYYCTAYVWLLFELVDEETSEFQPETSLAFFEHANLTDIATYNFLIEMLLNKSIAHFTSIFSDPDLRERKYQFVCAMNSLIEDRFREKYLERMRQGDELARYFENNIILTAKRNPLEAFAAYNEFFSPQISNRYTEVDLKKSASVDALGQFYTRVYMPNFPNTNERESFDHLLYYLEQAQSATDYCYHIILLHNQDGDVEGGVIFDYFKPSDAGVIEFIAVRDTMQSRGIGTQLYNKALSVLRNDAYRFGGALSHVFCEIDKPNGSSDSDRKYLHFWDKHRFKRLDFDYLQPALSADQHAIDNLWLVVYCAANESEIAAEDTMNFVRDYMRYSMNIDRPQENEEYLAMRRSIKSDKIALHNIL